MATSYVARKTVEADDTPGPALELDPEKLIDEVPAGVDYQKMMSDEAFLAEPVGIVLHALGQQENEPSIPVSVNGDRVNVVPGQLTRVKRYHVAQLLKARPDYVTHNGGDVNSPEQTHNSFFRQSTSRYNFDVVEDSPKGLSWLREMRRQYTRR